MKESLSANLIPRSLVALMLGIATPTLPVHAAEGPQLSNQAGAPPASGAPSTTPSGGAKDGGSLDTQADGGVSAPQLPLPAGSQLTLKQAISVTLKNHPQAAEAAAESNAAEEQVGEARSYLGPQLAGVSEYLRSTENGIGNTSYYNPAGILPRITGTNHDQPSSDTSQSWDTSNNYAGGVALSQFLLDFGRRRGFVAERRFEAAATKDQQTLVNLGLIFDVSQRYFNLLESRQLVRVYEKAVE